MSARSHVRCARDPRDLGAVGDVPQEAKERQLRRGKAELAEDLIRCYSENRRLEREIECGEEVVAYQRCQGGVECASSVHYHKVGGGVFVIYSD